MVTIIWIDFGIICIEQSEISIPSDMDSFRVEGYRRTMQSEPLYNEYYHFRTADKLPGYWYNIWLPEPICYEKSFFDISPKGIPCVVVVPEWSEYVGKLLEFYINESPVKKIAVLLRIEDTSNDIVHPECSLDKFMVGLAEGKIRWNELYYVHL